MGEFNPQKISEHGLTLGGRLGQGSYAVVYKAYNKVCRSNGTRQVLAVKCVAKNKICVTQTAQDNLIREIEILKKLDHPHIVRLVDFLWDKDYIYLIMEYCSAGDLSQFIRKRSQWENSSASKNFFSLPEPVTRTFLQMLASAVKYLRNKRISHMDLKPQNILLSYSPEQGITLKLADFGFSTKLYYGDKVTSMRGSPLYMAPEIFKKASYDARVDLWSIGVILFECLFGRAPFASNDMAGLMEQIVSDDVIVLPEKPVLSPCCRDLLTRLLKRDPDGRINFYDFFAHKFVDENYCPSEECAEVALQSLKRAEKIEQNTQCEKANDQFKAFKLYCEALDFFVCSLQYVKSKDECKSQELRHIIQRTLRKAEELKQSLKPISTPPTLADVSQTEICADESKLSVLWVGTPQVEAALTLKRYAENLLTNQKQEAGLEAAFDKYQLAIESLLKILSQSKDDKQVNENFNAERFSLLRRVTKSWLCRAEAIKRYADMKRLNFSATSVEAKEKEAQVPVEEKTRKMVQENFCRLQ